jgi:hypothetical protein
MPLTCDHLFCEPSGLSSTASNCPGCARNISGWLVLGPDRTERNPSGVGATTAQPSAVAVTSVMVRAMTRHAPTTGSVNLRGRIEARFVAVIGGYTSARVRGLNGTPCHLYPGFRATACSGLPQSADMAMPSGIFTGRLSSWEARRVCWLRGAERGMLNQPFLRRQAAHSTVLARSSIHSTSACWHS